MAVSPSADGLPSVLHSLHLLQWLVQILSLAFTNVSSAATGTPPKLPVGLCVCPEAALVSLRECPPLMLPTSEPLWKLLFPHLYLPKLAGNLLCYLHDRMGLVGQFLVLRVHQGLCHLSQATLVVLHVIHHVNKLIFTPVATFLLHGLGYAYQVVLANLQNLEQDSAALASPTWSCFDQNPFVLIIFFLAQSNVQVCQLKLNCLYPHQAQG